MAPAVPAPAVDATRCPLCGEPNRCAMEVQRESGQPQPPCWCTRVDFSRELLAAVPAPAQGRACLCAACAGRVPSRGRGAQASRGRE